MAHLENTLRGTPRYSLVDKISTRQEGSSNALLSCVARVGYSLNTQNAQGGVLIQHLKYRGCVVFFFYLVEGIWQSGCFLSETRGCYSLARERVQQGNHCCRVGGGLCEDGEADFG